MATMAGNIALAPHEIHLWLTQYEAAKDAGLQARYRALLNDEERDQEPRFHFVRDRLRYLVTRALVRTVLSRYMDTAPEDWTFETNSYGRPEISNEAAREHDFTFNVSHTHSMIILGVAKGRALGVDVENAHDRNVSLDIAGRYFAPPEVAELSRVPPDQQQQRFFEYWTLKESYIKARGMGLSLPLHKFSFRYPTDSGVDIAVDPELADTHQWQFWQFRPGREYLAAVCAQRVPGQATVMTMRCTVPMQSEIVFAPAFMRTSEY